MVREKRKKGFSIKFALSPAGLLGVGVVCFCVFLWMFLLGVWSGQTVLTSGKYEMSETNKTPATIEPIETLKPGKVKEKAVPAPVAKKEKKPAQGKQTQVKQAEVKKDKPAAEEAEEDPAFFAVQVAAFKDSTLAVKAVKSWQKKGYESFARDPEGPDDKFTRVYIGHFDSMDAAKKQAATLAAKEKIKPFIVLVPAE
jgi:cell division septation protein DedD